MRAITVSQLASLLYLLLKYSFCKGSSNSGILSAESFVSIGARFSVKSADQVIILCVALNACHQKRGKGKNGKSLACKVTSKVQETDSAPGVIHLIVAILLRKIHLCIDAVTA